jgi:hypothetical protein
VLRPCCQGSTWTRICTSIISTAARGWPVQVKPMKPTLKAPGSKLLKLSYDEPLSKFALKLNLRRYNEGGCLQLRAARHRGR